MHAFDHCQDLAQGPLMPSAVTNGKYQIRWFIARCIDK